MYNFDGKYNFQTVLACHIKSKTILSFVLFFFFIKSAVGQCNVGAVTGDIEDCQVLTRNQYRCFADSIVLKNASSLSGGATIDSIAYSCPLTIPSSKGFNYNDTSCLTFKLNLNPDSCICSNTTNKNYAIVEMDLEVFEKCNGTYNSRGYDTWIYRIFLTRDPNLGL